MNEFFYDLSFDEKLKFFVPTIYINTVNSKTGYVDKKATSAVLKSLDIEIGLLDKNIQNLLEITHNLRSEILFKKFEKNLKSKKTLGDLIEDNKFGYVIAKYIDQQIDKYLTIISENCFPLSLNISKDKDFYNSKVQTEKNEIGVQLHFLKNENGLRYTMNLVDDQKVFAPTEKTILILLDQPSWICFDKQIFNLRDINSNKLKPFFKNKHIDVPTRAIPTFFEKFVKDIVKKVDIEADGFDLITKNKITKCSITVEHNFFKNVYLYGLCFDYDGYIFKNSNSKNAHTIIETNNEGDISVIKFVRNSLAEKYYKDSLAQHFDIIETETTFFKYQNDDQTSQYSPVYYLVNNKKKLEDHGFEIAKLRINQFDISTNFATTTFGSSLKNDWFDIKLVIEVGEFTIYFQDIIKNILEKNPFYKLPNELYFMIPLEWFSKYSNLAKFSKTINKNLQLPKANFAILEEIQQETILKNSQTEQTYKPSNLMRANLRPYQTDGVKWLLEHSNNQLGACLADDMGLGKTIQILALLVAVQEKYAKIDNDFPIDLFEQTKLRNDFLKTLIVLPSSLIFNWFNEIKTFTPHFRILRYTGADRQMWHSKLDRYDIVLTSYGTATKDIEILKKYNFNYIILDESQQIKNKESLTFKALSKLSTINKISLSGTPIENSLSDLYAQMQFLNPDMLGSYHFFTNHFKNPIEKKQNQKALAELQTIVNPFILRRTKNDVLKDLPAVTEQIIYCNLEPLQKKWYETEKSKARNEVLNPEKSQNKLYVINVLMRLRQLANHPKMLKSDSKIASGKFSEVISYLQTLLKSEHKILIFSTFTTHLTIYEQWSKENKIDYCKITGEVNPEKRAEEVNKFQTQASAQIFFISLKAGGTGLNLTKASYVLLLDPWWNPFAEQQAISRAHRIGQLQNVHVVRFISKNTIEEKVLELQNSKKNLSNNVLNLDEIPENTFQNLENLLS
ncbi:MAG: hypothetical protein RLZZ312_1055 [Bacteroidota bacterium]